jgi:hypothetical protein
MRLPEALELLRLAKHAGWPAVYIDDSELGQPIDPRWIESRCPECNGHHRLEHFEAANMHTTRCPLSGAVYIVGVKGRVLTTAGIRKLKLVGIPNGKA